MLSNKRFKSERQQLAVARSSQILANNFRLLKRALPLSAIGTEQSFD